MMSDFVMDIITDDVGGAEGRTTAITAIEQFPLLHSFHNPVPFCVMFTPGNWSLDSRAASVVEDMLAYSLLY